MKLLDTWMIYSISIIFTLNRWSKEYVALNFHAFDTEAGLSKLNLSINNNTVSTKYMINGMMSLLWFAKASSHVSDLNSRKTFLTAKLLRQGYQYRKLHIAFSKFYRGHSELIDQFELNLSV